MNNDAKDRLQQIVDSACVSEGVLTGGEDELLAEFRELDGALRIPTYQAPTALIAEAKELMPVPVRRRVLARLVFSTLQPIAVRSPRPNSFQMVFESEEARVRLMYAPEGSGWDVVGQAEGEGWQALRGSKDLTCDRSGRFSFRAKSLGDTDLTLLKDDLELVIPAAEEAAPGGPSR